MLPHGLIGVLHLPPMPGDPGYGGGGFDGVKAHALSDAEVLVEAGIDALIVENFGSAPFVKGCAGDRIPPHQVALMANVVAALQSFGRPIGVNCLRNDVYSALGIAAASGADFVRVNVHSGAYLTDQGVIEGEAAHTLRYRQSIEASDVAILADVLVKHAQPLVSLAMPDAVEEVLGRGHADAVVITGGGTGKAVDHAQLSLARDVAMKRPVVIGSGLTPDNAPTFVPLAHAAIVGTYFKRGGHLRAPVDKSRVREMVQLCKGRFWQDTALGA